MRKADPKCLFHIEPPAGATCQCPRRCSLLDPHPRWTIGSASAREVDLLSPVLQTQRPVDDSDKVVV